MVTKPCEICGKLIEKRFPNQKYCTECSAEVTYPRKKKLNREDRERERQLEIHRKKYEKDRRNMVQTIDAARAAGMTYGQYTAMLRMKESI